MSTSDDVCYGCDRVWYTSAARCGEDHGYVGPCRCECHDEPVSRVAPPQPAEDDQYLRSSPSLFTSACISGRDNPVLQVDVGDRSLRLRVDFGSRPEAWVEINLPLEKLREVLLES